MFNLKSSFFVITIFCIIITGLGIYFIRAIEQEQLQLWLQQMGIWAPIIYISLYTLGTLLILPSTPLNLIGGAVFGIWWGTLWTTVAAVVAATVAFTFTRTIGRELVAQRLVGRWQVIDSEIRVGGLFYMFALRLLPIIPYGLVNFTAGLTAISYRDYLTGTIFGTVLGILPFIMMGAGFQALSQGDILPLIFASALTVILVAGATWYRRRRQNPQRALQQIEKNKD